MKDSYDWDECQTMFCLLNIKWSPLGKVLLNEENRLLFPKAENEPTVYRFRIRHNSKESYYIGETSNLRRRLGNYRNASQTQRTSLRIKGVLVDALCRGAEVSVSIVGDCASIDSGRGAKKIDLTSKSARCYVENAALLCSEAIDIKSLNKSGP